MITATTRNEYLFANVDNALSTTFELLALSGAIRTPGYNLPSSRSTRTDTKSIQDRFIEAVWVQYAAKEALSAAQWAWAVCRYTGMSEDRATALDTLYDHFAGLHKNPVLLRKLIEREFEVGETWCMSLNEISKLAGLSKEPTVRASGKVRAAIDALSKSAGNALNAAFAGKNWLPTRLAQ
jgi:hypothetical protein